MKKIGEKVCGRKKRKLFTRFQNGNLVNSKYERLVREICARTPTYSTPHNLLPERDGPRFVLITPQEKDKPPPILLII